mmetsp:Transcript_22170/g.39882  ORF Transcript_22170/g.39882 Transcript_22170/m.39882 type:complete len:611 (+) Transcript_22170:70-1902(+)
MGCCSSGQKDRAVAPQPNEQPTESKPTEKKEEDEDEDDDDMEMEMEMPEGFEDMLPRASQAQRSFRRSLLIQEDPRMVIALFFGPGDSCGPQGSANLRDVDVDTVENPSKWFAVFRPCSVDSIAKMRSSKSTGKGLNIKGKSAKQGALSGFVPFLQISKNEDVKFLSTAPASSRIKVFYSTSEKRQAALDVLGPMCTSLHKAYEEGLVRKKDMEADPLSFDDDAAALLFELLSKRMDDPQIHLLDSHAPKDFGLDVPELLLREAYITRQDITPPKGWEPGRASESAFMDMNFIALREPKEPKVVVFQHDSENAMNPWGLVMAYEERSVMPVVSDFDPFLFGSTGVQYDPITKEHQDLVQWCIAGCQNLIGSGVAETWTSSWLQLLKLEGSRGFHPKIPKYGFGDATSYQIVDDLVKSTAFCGAVRHGAECFNWYFPQELDSEFLVIWDGFGEFTPWKYLGEADLRSFLLERIKDKYSFPMNPAWLIRDPGWYDVLQAQRNSPSCQETLKSWFPADSGILEQLDEIHAEFPNGKITEPTPDDPQAINSMERADLAELKLRRHLALKRAKRKMRAFLVMQVSKKKSRAADQNADSKEIGGEPKGEFSKVLPS